MRLHSRVQRRDKCEMWWGTTDFRNPRGEKTRLAARDRQELFFFSEKGEKNFFCHFNTANWSTRETSSHFPSFLLSLTTSSSSHSTTLYSTPLHYTQLILWSTNPLKINSSTRLPLSLKRPFSRLSPSLALQDTFITLLNVCYTPSISPQDRTSWL